MDEKNEKGEKNVCYPYGKGGGSGCGCGGGCGCGSGSGCGSCGGCSGGSCGGGRGYGMGCGCGWHSGHRAFRIILGIVIVFAAFWCGVHAGELRATLGGYDYRSLHGGYMMGDGYGYPTMMYRGGTYGAPMMWNYSTNGAAPAPTAPQGTK